MAHDPHTITIFHKKLLCVCFQKANKIQLILFQKFGDMLQNMSQESCFLKGNITLYFIEVLSHNSLLLHLFLTGLRLHTNKERKITRAFQFTKSQIHTFFAPFLCNATIKVFLVMTNMIHCLNPISVTKRRQGSLIKRPETSLLSGNLGHVNICDNICFFKLWYHTFLVRRTLHSLTQYDLLY